MKRGDLFKWAGVLGIAPVAGELLPRGETALARGTQASRATSASTFTPIRPPAVPLAVRGPYLSTWQMADDIAGTWPAFWNGAVKAIAGIARIDGQPYVFAGDPRDSHKRPFGPPMTQVAFDLTPTQSRYTLRASGVTIELTFLSPIEARNLRRLSMPLSYIMARAYSHDGTPHRVSLYLDISGEWAHGDPSALITWRRERISGARGPATALFVTPANPTVLSEENDYPSWGAAVLATRDAPNVTFQIAPDQVVRAHGASRGRLDGTIDRDMPRAIDDRYPCLAFNADLGTVHGRPGAPFTLVIGHVREPAVSYLGEPVPPLWRAYWPTAEEMISFALSDADAAMNRANRLDARIMGDAMRTGGKDYAALCALALRQSFGATELVGTRDKPWLLLKEISSDGNVSTVDVIYPGSPVFLYTNPRLLKLLLDPILDNCERPASAGGWPKPFAIHDIGSSYPNATGHATGKEEDMPVEESANMLIMAAAYLRRVDAREAATFATQHYAIFKQWADYLVPHALDPGFQNQTDDFTGFIAHSVNLALKGIIGIGAMGIIAGYAGHGSDARRYGSLARSYIARWARKAQDPKARHLMLIYKEGATTFALGTWSLKYNAYADRLLGLNLVPAAVLREEAAWYTKQESQYGIPLDNRHTYTKGDWEMWTAASTPDAALRASLIHELYTFANTTASRVPFTDWYDTLDGAQQGFQARPVVGAMYALLAL